MIPLKSEKAKERVFHPKVKLDIHVFSKAAGVVIPQCFGVAKCLRKAEEPGNQREKVKSRK